MWRKLWTLVTIIIFVIGLGGILDDIQSWRNAMNWLSVHVPGGCDFYGNCGRWVFVSIGTLMAIALWVHSKQANRSQELSASEKFQRTANLLYGQPWWKRSIVNWWNRRNEPPWMLPPGYIYMKEAARKLYEASKAGKIPFGEASERLSGWSNDKLSQGSPEDILHWWAGHISKELPVYGQRPPSSIFKEIPRSDVKHFLFAEEATKLKDPIHDSVYYTNIAVQIEALDAQYNFQSGFHEK